MLKKILLGLGIAVMIFMACFIIWRAILKTQSKAALREIRDNAEIMYYQNKYSTFLTWHYFIGSINPNGEHHQYTIIYPIAKPSWSVDGNTVFYLGIGPAPGGDTHGYPAYWDRQTNRSKKCTEGVMLMTDIEAANNPDAPYEVFLQDSWDIYRYDIETCTEIEALGLTDDFESAQINGFSYLSETNELVYAKKIFN